MGASSRSAHRACVTTRVGIWVTSLAAKGVNMASRRFEVQPPEESRSAGVDVDGPYKPEHYWD